MLQGYGFSICTGFGVDNGLLVTYLLVNSHQFLVPLEAIIKATSDSFPQTPLESTPFPHFSICVRGFPTTSSLVFTYETNE